MGSALFLLSRVMPNIVHGMKEWTYTFDAVSKEQWIRQIESDLRQKTVASLQAEWWPGEPLIPLLHSEDGSDEPITLPASLFNQPPIIAEWISTAGHEASSVNQKILDALRQDTQTLILGLPDDSTWNHEGWFDGVFKDLITVSFEIEDFKETTFGLLEKIEPTDLIRINRKVSSPAIGQLLQPDNQQPSIHGSIRFIYRIESTGVWDEHVAKVINKLIEDLIEWTRLGFHAAAFFQQSILSLDADKVYFKQIIQARVLHLLWQNLKSHFTSESSNIPSQYLECHIWPSAQESSDHFLIRAATSGLAGAMSGFHTMCIHHSNKEDAPDFYNRANRNIHHLLQLESSMYKGVDPLSGAYSIDYYAKAWTQKIWNALRF